MKQIIFVMNVCMAGIILCISCDKENNCDDCDLLNKPPVVIAGVDRTVALPTDTVHLDGSGSFDPDGSIQQWQWRQISGPAALSFSQSSASFTVASGLAEGYYTLELSVKDNKGRTGRDSMKINVVSPPRQRAIIIYERTWNLWYDDFGDEIYVEVEDPTNQFINTYHEVYVSPDSTGNWSMVPQGYCNPTNTYSYIISTKSSGVKVMIISNCTLNYALAGQRVYVKVFY